MTIERFHSRGPHIRLFIGTKESFYIRKAGFYLGFIIWGRSPEWPKATSLLEGSAPPPGDFLKWICTKMQSGAFWDTILRNGTVCALTSSRLDDFFRYSYLYTVLMTIFLGGSFYPSNTLDRTLKRVQFPQGCLGKPTWPPWRHLKTLYYTSIFAMEHKKIFADDNITALYQTNMSPKHYIKRYKQHNELR